MTKPRVAKNYENLEGAIIEKLNKSYPMGYEKHLIKFQNKEGKLVSALPFETDDKCYLIRMTGMEAKGMAAQETVEIESEEEEDYEAILANADHKDDFNLEEE